jgi:ribosomal protein S18 acetylase RimI-like enzyme
MSVEELAGLDGLDNATPMSEGAGEPTQSTSVASLSRRLWELDWSRYLPWRFEGIDVVHSSFDGALPFVQAHYAAIFEAESRASRFLADPMTEPKKRFCREMDVFLFQEGGATVGVLMSHPLDWSTYYMRSAAFVPEFRGKNLLSRCVEATYEPLRAAGVERVEVECAASNAVVIRMLAGLGFAISSTANSERFGAVVRFTKFLREEAETAFLRQFCAVSMQRVRAPLEERRRS